MSIGHEWPYRLPANALEKALPCTKLLAVRALQSLRRLVATLLAQIGVKPLVTTKTVELTSFDVELDVISSSEVH